MIEDREILTAEDVAGELRCSKAHVYNVIRRKVKNVSPLFSICIGSRKLVRLNKTREDYLAKFQELIESYNAGSRNIDELFRELVALSRSLSEEEERHVRENLSEEELTVFDILTRPGPELTAEEREEVKKVTRQLLERLKHSWCWTGGSGLELERASGKP